MLTVINQEDATVAAAVASQLPAIATAVDEHRRPLRPGWPPLLHRRRNQRPPRRARRLRVPAHLLRPARARAGPDRRRRRGFRTSCEHAEDSPEEGASDLIAAGFGIANATDPSAPTPDTLVGIAASGRTPYVLGAMLHARKLKAFTIGLSCVADSPVSKVADLAIAPVTGPEVITGSTRMKAGTATKLVLNMLSTGVMVRTGAVYGNLMVNVKPTNDKLIDRAHRIIMAATGSRPSLDRASRACSSRPAG